MINIGVQRTRRVLRVFILGAVAVGLLAGLNLAQDHGGHQGPKPDEKKAAEPEEEMEDMPGMPGMKQPKKRGKDNLLRIEPGKQYSPPPPLMGKQMGRVTMPSVPALGYELDGDIKVFTLIAQPVHTWFNDGKPNGEDAVLAQNRYVYPMNHEKRRDVLGWGYNGSIPGPTIEAVEGDTIRVILKNELPEPTSIHWHGIELPNDMDGVAGVTEAATPPGGTRIYQFKLYQNGTFLYHSHFNVMKQEPLGLAGMLVIHPREEKNRPDVDVSILLQQWVLDPGNPNPDIVGMDFNWFTFNGKSAPDIPNIVVKQGQRVRIRFGNLSMDSHPIHMHGYSFKIVGTEGGPIPESAQWPVATVNVDPGTTRDIEFVAWNAGLWMLHCHRLHHVMNSHAEIPMGIMGAGGMNTMLHVMPEDEKAPWRHPNEGGK